MSLPRDFADHEPGARFSSPRCMKHLCPRHFRGEHCEIDGPPCGGSNDTALRFDLSDDLRRHRAALDVIGARAAFTVNLAAVVYPTGYVIWFEDGEADKIARQLLGNSDLRPAPENDTIVPAETPRPYDEVLDREIL